MSPPAGRGAGVSLMLVSESSNAVSRALEVRVALPKARTSLFLN